MQEVANKVRHANWTTCYLTTLVYNNILVLNKISSGFLFCFWFVFKNNVNLVDILTFCTRSINLIYKIWRLGMDSVRWVSISIINFANQCDMLWWMPRKKPGWSIFLLKWRYAMAELESLNCQAMMIDGYALQPPPYLKGVIKFLTCNTISSPLRTH